MGTFSPVTSDPTQMRARSRSKSRGRTPKSANSDAAGSSASRGEAATGKVSGIDEIMSRIKASTSSPAPVNLAPAKPNLADKLKAKLEAAERLEVFF